MNKLKNKERGKEKGELVDGRKKYRQDRKRQAEAKCKREREKDIN